MTRILDLYRHMRWADAMIWRAVQAQSAAQEDSRIRSLFYHLHLVQHVWLQVWTRQPPDYPEESSFESLAAVRDWSEGFHAGVEKWLLTVDEARIAEVVDLPFEELVVKQLGRSPEPSTVGDTLLQVALHTTHHRAQLMARLRELGGEPPMVDYIAWVWMGRPAVE